MIARLAAVLALCLVATSAAAQISVPLPGGGKVRVKPDGTVVLPGGVKVKPDAKKPAPPPPASDSQDPFGSMYEAPPNPRPTPAPATAPQPAQPRPAPATTTAAVRPPSDGPAKYDPRPWVGKSPMTRIGGRTLFENLDQVGDKLFSKEDLSPGVIWGPVTPVMIDDDLRGQTYQRQGYYFGQCSPPRCTRPGDYNAGWVLTRFGEGKWEMYVAYTSEVEGMRFGSYSIPEYWPWKSFDGGWRFHEAKTLPDFGRSRRRSSPSKSTTATWIPFAWRSQSPSP